MPTADPKPRIAIVTGANAGLGFQTAWQLAERGFRVILACRSRARAEAAQQKIVAAVPAAEIEISQLDASDLSSIRAFAEECQRRLPRLDLLCNNAGVIAVPYARSSQGFELHMATNCFGPFALTAQLLGLLRATPKSRVVNISSQIHRWGKLPLDDLNWERRRYKPFGAYAQSKLATTCITVELNRRLQCTNRDVIALLAHPGFCLTDVQPTSRLQRVSGKVLGPLFVRSGLVHSAAEGARCSLHALTSADVRGGDYVGPNNWLGSSGPPARAMPSKAAADPQLAGELWERSCQATGFSPSI